MSGITAHSIGRFTASNGDKFMVAQPLEGIVTNPILGRTVRLQAKLRANTALTPCGPLRGIGARASRH